jgi:cation diffusion facilitator CzcD-associated flavoprotein CzcO
MANWLEHYAEALDLNVWTSSIVTQAVPHPTTNKWTVVVRRADGTERIFCVKHLIFATGLSGPTANLPKIPGMVGSFDTSSTSCIADCGIKGEIQRSGTTLEPA